VPKPTKKADESKVSDPSAIDWNAMLADPHLRGVLRTMGSHAARGQTEIAESVWLIAGACQRSDPKRRNEVLKKIAEVALALHASVVDNDQEQIDELWKVSHRILRSDSPKAREHAAVTGVAMERHSDWGKALRDHVESAMHLRASHRFESYVALLMPEIPAFASLTIADAKSRLRQWFGAHPERLAIENAEELAVQCCIALGMPVKDARNAIKAAPAMKKTRLTKKQR
jgi:hypothetical protein